MYFSLITPNPGYERTAAHEWLRSSYAEHQWLWRFFPAPKGTARDFLFRRRDVDRLPRYYTVSSRPPETDSQAWHVQSRAYQPRIPAGTRLSFDLRANPAISRTHESGARRHDVVMDEKKRLLAARGLPSWESWAPDRTIADAGPDPRPPLYDLVHRTCSGWLATRAEQHGFTLDASSLTVAAYQQHGGKNGQLRFSTVDYGGELVVTNEQRFANALIVGIGRAKAFGCGLLLVRRVA